MKIFFDTEFTGLHKNTTLISLGMIDENGRSFYAEFLGYNSRFVDEWIKENVINHLKFSTCISNWCNCSDTETVVVGYTYFIRQKLNEWLSIYDSVELVSDCCHYDMVLFIDIFGGAFDLPKNICPACHDINQDIARRYDLSDTWAFDKSREEILKEHGLVVEGDKHNALYDAEVIKAIYEEVLNV